MKKLLNISLLFLAMSMITNSHGQQKKVFVSGAARGILYMDDYSTAAEDDTTTARKTQSGQTMVDLGVNIQPNDKILVQGMVRIQNEYGGFWGAGVTFDVRQLYIKGIIANSVKYQLGDINYKLSAYTLNNQTGLVSKFGGVMVDIPLKQVEYDLFYTDNNTWRQQGFAVDFGLEYTKVIESTDFHVFTSRVLATDFGTQEDRLYSGGSVVLNQSKWLKLGFQYANLYDLKGTTSDTVYMRNPSYSFSAEADYKLDNVLLNASLETGQSKLEWQGDPEAPLLNDFFYDINLRANFKKYGVKLLAGYRNVGADYRSAGSQTMQINYSRAPQAYQRYGNDQTLRHISMLDIYRDASLYQTQIREGLMVFDPRYNNATPYGVATPNRSGFLFEANYEDLKKRWSVKASSELLSDIFGEGTTALTKYNTNSLLAEIKLNNIINIGDRRLWISGLIGEQNSTRSGEEDYEAIDLATRFYDVNLTATLFLSLDLIAEYRIWKSNGSTQLAGRNVYSQINDYNEYTIDYKESILGAGLKYRFKEDMNFSFMWQTFQWDDYLEETLPYQIDTWTIYFTMKF